MQAEGNLYCTYNLQHATGHQRALRYAINHADVCFASCLAASWYPGPWEELTPKMLPTKEVHWASQLGPDRWLITE